MKLKIKRLIAIIIDILIIKYIIVEPLRIFYQQFNTTLANIIFTIITLVISLGAFLCKDCLIGYESLGKKIMRLKIYQEGNVLCDKIILIKRVIFTIFTSPLYPFMILYNNKSKGDIKCNTEVKSFRKNSWNFFLTENNKIISPQTGNNIVYYIWDNAINLR